MMVLTFLEKSLTFQGILSNNYKITKMCKNRCFVKNPDKNHFFDWTQKINQIYRKNFHSQSFFAKQV